MTSGFGRQSSSRVPQPYDQKDKENERTLIVFRRVAILGSVVIKNIIKIDFKPEKHN